MMESQESQSPPTTLQGRKTTPQVELISGATLADVAPTEEAVERAAAPAEDEGDDEVFYEDEDGGGGPPRPPCSLEVSPCSLLQLLPQYADTAFELERPESHTWGDQPGRRDAAGSAAPTLASEGCGSLAELQTHPGPGEGKGERTCQIPFIDCFHHGTL